MKRLGNFAIDELLGDGGMSIVWGGRHVVLGTAAAIKVLRPEYANREPHRSAFFAEARSHARLSHPGILRILDVGEVDEAGAAALGGTRAGAPFIAMERASGNLEDDLPLPNWSVTYGVLLELLDALAHAHARGVIHRDLKPGNVMRVDRDGDRTYQIGDFGLAHGRDSTEEGDVAMGPTAGTPMYMAPEQINGRWRDFGPETDLYALGCVAYLLVSGRPPFDGDTLFQIVTGHTAEQPPALTPLFAIPDGLEAWIRRLLEKAPHARYRRAADAAHALREVSRQFRDPATGLFDVPTPIWSFGGETLIDQDFQPSGGVVAPGSARDAMAGDGLGLFDLVEGPLVGREAESRRLRAALLAARQHRGASIVLLRGPAGVGLSRLARSFATRMDELGLAFVHEANHTLVQAAHEGLTSMLEAHFGTWGLDRAGVWDRIHEKLQSDHATLPDDVAAAVVELVCRSREPQEGPSFTFRTSRERSALIDAALRVGHEDRPRLFLFDDVQWGRESLEFVRDRVEADAQAVFVLTVREDAVASTFADALLADLKNAPNAAVFDLTPPSVEDVDRFVGSLLRFSPESSAAIAAAAGSDYRLARQLVGYLLDTGGLRLTTDGFELVGASLPASWDELWSGRLSAILAECELDDEALWGIEVAAELGRYPERGELVDALALATVSIEPRLHEALAGKGLIVVRGDAWVFALQSLVEHLRARVRSGGRVQGWSRACADAIALRAPTRDRASRIAWHRLQGLDLEAAFGPMRLAIRGYSDVDPDRADELLRWWEDTCDALDLPHDARRRIDGTLMRANLAQSRGQTERHRTLVEAALRRSRRSGYDEGEAWALLRTGQSAMDDGGLDFALDRFRRAESKFRRVAEHEGRAAALFGAALATMRLGEVEASIGDYRAAIEIYETIGNVERAVTVMSYLAYSHLVRGDYEAAEDLCMRAIDDARRLGDRTLEFESMATLGEVARFRGDFDKARDYLREVLIWRRTLGLRDAAVTEFTLALAELGAGNVAVATQMLLGCEEAFVARGLDGRLPLVLIALAVAALARQDDAAFEHFWRRAAPSFRDGGFVHVDVLWCAEFGLQQPGAPAEVLGPLARDQRSRLGHFNEAL